MDSNGDYDGYGDTRGVGLVPIVLKNGNATLRLLVGGSGRLLRGDIFFGHAMGLSQPMKVVRFIK